MAYIFHTDPGHGWLAVPLADIPPENVEWISGYSYWDPKSQTVYLEEDCDIRLAPEGWQDNMRESYAEHTHVRRLPHWPERRTYQERLARLTNGGES